MFVCIDTSVGTSVALVHEGQMLWQAEEQNMLTHAEIIGVFLEQALMHVGARTLDAVVVGVGPGPFTGLRVGIVAGQVLAFARGIPVWGVVSHDAVAAQQLADLQEVEPVLVVSDAKRKQRHWSAYAGIAEGIPVRCEGPQLSDPDGSEYASWHRNENSLVSAGQLGRIAWLKHQQGREQDPVVPLYLRSPDVTVSSITKKVGT